MKLKKQVTVCGAAIFCVAVFSLYLMLDRVQHDPTRHHNGGNFPRSQISVLQNRIEQLEQLLEENHEIIVHIKDSVLELTANAEGQPVLLPFHMPNGSWMLPPESRPNFYSVSSQDCQFSLGSKPPQTDLQMLAVSALLPYDNQDGGVWKQGFDITYEPHEWDTEPLQVFVVPHSHNDPGWIKTFDKYYFDQTQHILNCMVVKLQEDPRRRFIWSEISFFSKWWDNISAQKQAAVRRLVGNGQLEMATGGWVMPDEANSHYFAMIDQLIEGHQWLEKNIGVMPRSGWAVDPFGHSSTMPYLLRRANLTSMLIQRVHYAIKKHFAATQNLEFMWRQSWDTDSSTDILCHMMPFYSYDVPHTCGPDPKICCQFDFKRLPGGRINCPWKVPPKAVSSANVAERALLLLDQYRKKSKLYRSKVLLVPLGDDFRYDKPQEWDAQFLNYQRLFDYLNAHPDLHVQAQFGTLSDYFDALYKRVGIVPGMRPPSFPVLSGDFFSYADREDHYWTGYYTSRPFYKSLGRVLEAHLRSAEVLYSLAVSHARHAGMDSKYPLSDYALLTDARRNLGLFQHHDAITGTAKEAVVVDYGVRLLHSLMNLKRVVINAAHYLVLADKEAYHYDLATPFLSPDETRLNQDSLPEKTVMKLDAAPRFVIVFNPLEQERLSVVFLLVNTPRVRVASEEGLPLAVQLSACWTSATDMAPEVYQVSVMIRLQPLGLTVLQVSKSFDSHNTLRSSVRLFLHGRDLPVHKHEAFPVRIMPAATEDFCLENRQMQACFSGTSGLLKSVHRVGEEQERRLQSQFLIYGTRSTKDKSGAYLFLPDGEAKPYIPKDPPVVRVTEGPFFSEVALYYQHIQTVVRLYNVPGVEGLSLEVSCLVDIRDQVNKELALRFSTDIESKGAFFTDLNGFQIQPRQYLKKLPLQANFYPMPVMAYIQDGRSRLTLHTTQALGASSLSSGELEVILDRRLMQDDNRGLGQGLKDNKQTWHRFRLLLERRSAAETAQDSRPTSFPSLLSHMTSMHLNTEVLAMPVAQEKPPPPALRSFQPFSATMPCDFHLLNLRMLQGEDDSLPSMETALILHRKGFDCGLEARSLGFNCTTTLGTGDYARAEQDASQAIDVDPGDVKGLFRRSQALQQLGRLDQALSDLQRCVSLEPKNRALQEALRDLGSHMHEKVRAAASTDSKVEQMFRVLLDPNEKDQDKKQKAAQNLIVLAREEPGAEKIFQNDGVHLLLQLLDTERLDMVLAALRTLTGLCRGHRSRTVAVLTALGPRRFFAVLELEDEQISLATYSLLQVMFDSLKEGLQREVRGKEEALVSETSKELKLLLKQLLEALARESISPYGRDSILNLLIAVVPRKSLQEPNNSLTLWVIDQGLKEILAVGGTVAHVPGSLRVTENSHMSTAVLLSKLYGDLKCDVERENFHLLCENSIRGWFQSDGMPGKLQAIRAVSCLLQGPSEAGNRVLELNGIMESILSLCASSREADQLVAVEALIHAADKAKHASFITANGVTLLKEIYKHSERDSIRIRALVGLCKLGSAGGTDFSMKQFAEGSTLKLAKQCRKWLCSKAMDVGTRFWAAEGLAYLTLDADVKEELVEDLAALQALFQLARSENRTVMFAVTSAVVNCTSSYDQEELDPQMVELAKYAKEHIPEKHPKDKPEFVRRRVRKLLAAGVVSALSCMVKNESPALSASCRELISRVFLALVEDPEDRGVVVAHGGGKALIPLALDGTEVGQTRAAQALAKITITTAPEMAFPGERVYEVVRPLVGLLHLKRTGLENFEGLMALTNLAGTSERLRQKIVKEKAVPMIEGYMFEEHEMIRLAATECMCNMALSLEVAELFLAEGSDRLKLLVLYSGEEDERLQRAAAGTLAVLTSLLPPICSRIPQVTAHWLEILQALLLSSSPELQHRGVVVVRNMVVAEKELAEQLMASETLEILSVLAGLEKEKPQVAQPAQDCLAQAVAYGMIKPQTVGGE